MIRYQLKIIALILSLSLLLHQTIFSVDALGLGIEPFTSPVSKVQEDEAALRSFLLDRIFLLKNKGFDPLKDKLSIENFPTQNLYAYSDENRANRSKRVLIESIAQQEKEDAYTLIATVNGRHLIADITFSRDDIDVSVRPLDTKGIRFFPAVPDLVIDQNVLALVRRSVEDRDYLYIEANLLAMSRSSSAELMRLLRKAYEINILEDVKEIERIFADVDGIRPEEMPLKDLITNGNGELIRAAILKIQERRPEIGKDLAVLCYGIGLIFYLIRHDPGYAYTAFRKCELFYRLALDLDKENLDYKRNLAHVLGKIGSGEEADRLMEEILNDPRATEYDIKNTLVNRSQRTLKDCKLKIHGWARNPSLFSEQRGEVEESIQDIFMSLRSQQFSTYPRAISVKGMASCAMAELLIFEYDYVKRFRADELEKTYAGTSLTTEQHLLARIFAELSDAMRGLRKGHDVARAFGLNSQTDHARRMFEDGVKTNILSSLDYCARIIAERKTYLADVRVVASIKNLVSSIQSALVEIDNHEKGVLQTVGSWANLQYDTIKLFKSKLKEAVLLHGGEEIRYEEVLGDLKENIIMQILPRYDQFNPSSPEGNNNFVKEIVSKVVDKLASKARLNDRNIKIVSAVNSLDADLLTIDNIKKEIEERYAIKADDNVLNEARRLANFLDLTIIEESEAQERNEAKTGPVDEGAVSAISFVKDPERLKGAITQSVYGLKKALTDQDWKIRWVAAELAPTTLSAVKEEASRNEAISALKRVVDNDESARVRVAASQNLVELGQKAPDSVVIYSAVIRRDAETIKNRIAGAKEMFDALMDISKDPDRSVRRNLAEVLGELDFKKAQRNSSLRCLGNMLLDKNENVRMAAAVSLSKLKPVSKEALNNALDNNNPGGYYQRIVKYKKILDILCSWMDHPMAQFAVCLAMQDRVKNLEQKIADLRSEEVRQGDAATKRDKERASVIYYEIESEFSILDDMNPARKMEAVKNIIKDKMAKIKEAELDPSSFEGQWLESDISLLNNLTQQLQDLLNESNIETFLSYDRFMTISERCDEQIERIGYAQITLESYKEVLTDIEEGKKEAQFTSRLLGSSNLLDDYIRDLETFENQNLLGSALREIGFEGLPENDKINCKNIARRRKFIQHLREVGQMTREMVERFRGMAKAAGEDRVTLLQGEILAVLKEEVSPANNAAVDILGWGTDLCLRPLSENFVNEFVSPLKKKVEIANEIQTLRLEIGDMAKTLENASIALQDPFIGQTKTTMADLESQLSSIINEKLLPQRSFNANGYSTYLDNIAGEMARIRGMYGESKKAFYKWWLGRLKGEIICLKNFISSWDENWVKDFARPDEKRKLRDALNGIEAALAESRQGGQDIERKVSLLFTSFAQAAMIIQAIGNKYESSGFERAEGTLRQLCYTNPNAHSIATSGGVVMSGAMELAEMDLLTASPFMDRISGAIRGGFERILFVDRLDVHRMQFAVIPVFDDNGLMNDVAVHLFRENEKSPYVLTLSLSGRQSHFVMDWYFLKTGFIALQTDSRGVGREVSKILEKALAASTGNNINPAITKRESARIAKMFDRMTDTAGYLNLLEQVKTELGLRIEMNNKLVSPKDGEFAGIYLFPPYFCDLMLETIAYYKNLVNISPASQFEPNTPIDIDQVFRRIIVRGALTKTAPPDEQDAFILAMEEKSRSLQDFMQDPRFANGLNEVDRVQAIRLIDTLMERLQSLIKAQKAWKAKFRLPAETARIKNFYSSALKLLNKVSGRSYDINALPPEPETRRPMMTFIPAEEGEKEINIFSLCPPVEEYNGIYFNPAEFRFEVLPTETGAKSFLLREVLDKALDSFFFMHLVSADLMHKYKKDPITVKEIEMREEWLKKFQDLYSAITSSKTINIAVVKNLPVNSMMSGNTILFDQSFIEFILTEVDKDHISHYILGERLAHEFGHITRRDSGLDMIEDEVKQIEIDIIFYTQAMSESPFLKDLIDDFTHKIVKSDKWNRKFSSAFHTAKLFTKIQGWAKKYGSKSERELVKIDIREFVIETLKDVNIIPARARLFPALPPEGGALRVLPLLLNDAWGIKKIEMGILDSISARDKTFLEKTRKIAISASLIPKCQRGLVDEINKRSKAAFKAGYTKDLIEIVPFSAIHNIRSNEKCDVVVILDSEEAGLYNGNEKRLLFAKERDFRDANYPILINGLVAAGRAVLYDDMTRLREILMRLSGKSDLELPGADELEKYLQNDREAFAKVLIVTLPALGIEGEDARSLNNNIVSVTQFA